MNDIEQPIDTVMEEQPADPESQFPIEQFYDDEPA